MCVFGFKDFDGNPIQFESEIKHLEDWCEAHGLTIDKFEHVMAYSNIVSPKLKVIIDE